MLWFQHKLVMGTEMGCEEYNMRVMLTTLKRKKTKCDNFLQDTPISKLFDVIDLICTFTHCG